MVVLGKFPWVLERVLDVEAEALHTGLVLSNEVVAFARVLSVDEETLVSGLFLRLTNAAWLWFGLLLCGLFWHWRRVAVWCVDVVCGRGVFPLGCGCCVVVSGELGELESVGVNRREVLISKRALKLFGRIRCGGVWVFFTACSSTVTWS